MTRNTILAAALLVGLSAFGKVSLPAMFRTGMVLQRNQPIAVWGKANPGQLVTVAIHKKDASVTADSTGYWQVLLPKMRAGGPYTLTVSDGVESVLLDDVLIGDVWLCSGQSNIDVTIERVYPLYTDEIDDYANNSIRLLRVKNVADTHGELDDIAETEWRTLSKNHAWQFSAVGYFLGKRMYEKTGVPQGIIVNSWGGTPIEAWIGADSIRAYSPVLADKTRLYQDDEMVRSQQEVNRRADHRWRQLLDERDPGVAGAFVSVGYDDSGWKEVDQYSMEWAKTGGRGIIGSIWLRQHVSIDSAHAGQPARLLLGTIFDSDFTYVNGQEVGRTYYQYPPRRYDIPEGLLREGDNVIAIRLINKYGTAHFLPHKPYLIAFGNDRFCQAPLPSDRIELSNRWLHHAGAEMPSCPSGDVSLQNLPSTLYNAVVHPLAPLSLSGIVWYQGESNTGNPRPYARLLKMMMGGWRHLWQRPDLPFVIVELADYDPRYQSSNGYDFRRGDATVRFPEWEQLREAQRNVAAADPHASLASAVGLGETVDIHPLRKKELAERIVDAFSLILK